jgi:transcription termination factor Rho
MSERPHFEKLTPIFPQDQIKLETTRNELSTRLMDMVSPIGRGQRGLIVSPPKAGKTTVLKNIANGITANSPDIHLMVALIGERPEEVTDWERSVAGAEVISSTFDETPESHCRVAEMTTARAKRLVESGGNVVVFLDSITRLSRAYNLSVPTSGKTLSGGIDPGALVPPKTFFGSGRNIENAGSLTMLASCLIDTGSRMDEVIYEEFKGTGNWELILNRKLAERGTFPAVDVLRSGTRRVELLLDENQTRMSWLLRRMLSAVGDEEAIELMMDQLRKTQVNADFLELLTKQSL